LSDDREGGAIGPKSACSTAKAKGEQNGEKQQQPTGRMPRGGFMGWEVVRMAPHQKNAVNSWL